MSSTTHNHTSADDDVNTSPKYPFRRYPQNKNKLIFYLQWVILVVVVGSILTFCLFMNVLQITATLIGKLFGAKKFALQGVTCGGGFAWVVFLFFVEVISGLKLEFSGDDVPDYENAIIIANHVSDLDPFLSLALAQRKGMLGNSKYMAKKTVRYIPFIGWGLDMMGCVFLERNWLSDQQSLYKSFRHLTENNIPVQLVSYLEGTRITDKKLVEAVEYAKENGLKEPRAIMLPRTKGLYVMINELSKNPNIKYVYDFTFGYCDGIIVNSDFLSRNLRGRKVLVNVKRIPISEIPINDEKLFKQWCYDRWYRKDEMLVKLSQSPEGDRHFEGEPILNYPYQVKNWFGVPFDKFNPEKPLSEKKAQ